MSTTSLPKNESMTRSSKRYREIPMKEKATLRLSQQLVAQITYNHLLHKNIEWSGFLFYRAVEGSILDPANLVLEADGMYILDVGSSAYTSFDVDGETLLEIVETYPDFDESKKGLIHTHHNMNCFFSGTDQDELQDNADKHVYYLSLIVNHSGGWCARIAVAAKLKTQGNSIESLSRRDEVTGEWITFDPQEVKVEEEEDVLYLIDCNIEHLFDDYYLKNLDQLEEKKKAKRALPPPPAYNNSNSANSFAGSLTPPYWVATLENARTTLVIALVNALKVKPYYKGVEYDSQDYFGVHINNRPFLFDLVRSLAVFLAESRKKRNATIKKSTIIGNVAKAVRDAIDEYYGATNSLPLASLNNDAVIQMTAALKNSGTMVGTNSYSKEDANTAMDIIYDALDLCLQESTITVS